MKGIGIRISSKGKEFTISLMEDHMTVIGLVATNMDLVLSPGLMASITQEIGFTTLNKAWESLPCQTVSITRVDG